jgi:hypothetical protein
MWEKGEITKIHSGSPPANLPHHPARPSNVTLVSTSRASGTSLKVPLKKKSKIRQGVLESWRVPLLRLFVFDKK